MRIFDPEQDRSLHKVSIFLTSGEAREPRDSLEELIEGYERPELHHHVNDAEYQHEIAVAIYDESNLDPFLAERARRLILEDR